jgi:hypothetical protein
MTTHHCAEEMPPGAPLVPPADALPGGPDGGGPCPPPPVPVGDGFVDSPRVRDDVLVASARRVAADSSGCGAARSLARVASRAAGAPLARISAMRAPGGRAGPAGAGVSAPPCGEKRVAASGASEAEVDAAARAGAPPAGGGA